jgi:hypothetical protein
MLRWIVAGVEYPLDGWTVAKLLDFEGFSMPPIRRLTERGSLQHGDTDRGFRLDPRILNLSLVINGTDMNDFYAKRATLSNIFKPRNTHGQLRFVRGSTVRQLDCHLLQLSEGDRQYKTQKFVASLKANNPTWYDPTLVSVNFAMSLGGDLGEIPMVVPMLVGASVLDASQVINYQGNYETHPIVRITGPVTDVEITHVQTGYKLDFDGITIGAGEWIEVDTRYGRKSVVDNAGANRIADLTKDSDLSLFSIVPSPEVFGGINTINITGESVSAATSVSLSYYSRYIGV